MRQNTILNIVIGCIYIFDIENQCVSFYLLKIYHLLSMKLKKSKFYQTSPYFDENVMV